MRARAGKALVAAVTGGLALVVAGCGVPSTGVVQVGEPAGGVRPNSPVFFLRDGVLVPAFRGAQPLDVEGAVLSVFKGPSGDEVTGGLTTALPPLRETPRISVTRTRIIVDLGSTEIRDEAGLSQLVCTAALARRTSATDAERPPGAVTVVAAGRRTDGTADRCDVAGYASPAGTPGGPATAEPHTARDAVPSVSGGPSVPAGVTVPGR